MSGIVSLQRVLKCPVDHIIVIPIVDIEAVSFHFSTLSPFQRRNLVLIIQMDTWNNFHLAGKNPHHYSFYLFILSTSYHTETSTDLH